MGSVIQRISQTLAVEIQNTRANQVYITKRRYVTDTQPLQPREASMSPEEHHSPDKESTSASKKLPEISVLHYRMDTLSVARCHHHSPPLPSSLLCDLLSLS
jgi:hypothetical protein